MENTQEKLSAEVIAVFPDKVRISVDDIEDFDFGDEDDDLDEDVKEAEEVYDTDEDEETE